MNILRKAFTMTPEDRALAREIAAYPAKASSAVVVLPRRSEPETQSVTTSERPNLSHLSVRLG